MDTPLIQSSLAGFIDPFKDILGDNLGIVLAFVAGILVWLIMKNWIFGSSGGLTYEMEAMHDLRNRTWRGGGNEM